MFWWITLAASGLLAAILLLLYLFRYEPTNFKISNISINIDTDTATVQGAGREGKIPILKILHLSDFHLRKGFKGGRLFDFVRSLAKREYDLIFITGDIVENKDNVDYLISMLKPLKAKYGKYAVLGVHDHYQKALYEFARNMLKRKKSYYKVNDIPELKKRLGKIGIEVLENENRILEIDDAQINSVEIVGLGDPVIEKTDLAKAFKGLETIGKEDIIDELNAREAVTETFKPGKNNAHRLGQQGKLRFVLIHTPDSWIMPTLARKNTDIVFAGHTHGGQVRLPLIGAIISGCRIETRFASGLFYFQKMVLYISRGLGEGKYSQFRACCPPEAGIITLNRIT